MTTLLRIYKWPSQAFWRYLELQALRQIHFERPILEIRCGDGQFSAMIFEEVDDAIDANPRSVEKCRRLAGHLYRQVRCLDARELQPAADSYATIFANCVMEHIPELEKVLTHCFHGLRPGGKLVITVPLVQMNDHLLFPWRWYAKLRQRQLAHVNLLGAEKWENLLRGMGFARVELRPYLSGRACRFWDAVDSPGCIGFGRYRLAPALGLIAEKLLPARAKSWGVRRLATWLSARARLEQNQELACAALVLAWKTSHGAQT